MSGFDPTRAVSVLRVLASAPRLAILRRLLDGDCSVAALETGLGFRQPGLSQNLGALREAGLVASHRDARSVTYSMASAEARRLATTVLAAFGADTAIEPAAPDPTGPSGPIEERQRPDGVARFARVLT